MPKTLYLIKTSFKDVWQARRSLVPIILLIMIPVVIIQYLTNSEQAVSSYGSFATLVMNIAVVSTIIKLKTGSSKVSLNQAYYAGTAQFVAFVCVVGLLGLQLIPALIGGLVYVSGSTGATVGLSTPEKFLLGGVWLLFAIPTLRWLTRSVFALYLVQDPKTTPVAAVKASSALVRGKSWLVFGRLLAGGLLLIILLLIPSLAISTLPETAGWLAKVGTGLLQILSALLLVPFASMYGYNILEALGGKPTTS